MPIPKIISVCSKCNIKSNTCKLVQYNKSKNYSIICNDCYTNNNENDNENDIVLNIINYNGKHTLPDDSCIQKYKRNCQKCYSYIKHKATLLGYKIINYLKSIKCCLNNSNDDTIKLKEIV